MSILGGPRPSAAYVERQSLTRIPATPADPTTKSSNSIAFQAPQASVTPGDGLVIAGLFGVVVSVFPPIGATLSGAGTLKCWVYNPFALRWTRADNFDIDLSTTSGFPAYTWGTFQNISRLGMLMNWLTDSVTTSAGAYVDVRLDGYTSTGPRGT